MSTKALGWPQHFSRGFFQPLLRGQLIAQSCDGIWPNFELIQDFMVEGYLNENEGARVATTLLFDFPDSQGQLTP